MYMFLFDDADYEALMAAPILYRCIKQILGKTCNVYHEINTTKYSHSLCYFVQICAKQNLILHGFTIKKSFLVILKAFLEAQHCIHILEKKNLKKIE